MGSTTQGNGDFDSEVKNRIKTGWNRWRQVTSILCDKSAPVMINGVIIRTVVRPAIKCRLDTKHTRAALNVDMFGQKARQSRLR